MRFIKIFLICFFSLVGVCGSTVGIMYAVGAFEEPKIEPQEISFTLTASEEQSYISGQAIYTCEDFYITINTTTEKVNQNDLTLSINNAVTTNVVGKVSDGVIIIPSTAKIGERFKVEIVKTAQTFGGDAVEWIKGGISKITAKSTTNITMRPVSIDVYVDTPVYAIELQTKANSEDAETNADLALGSIFNIKAKFIPEASKYMFNQSQTETRQEVLKSLFVSQGVANAQYYSRYNESANSYESNVFVANDINSGLDINGFVLSNAIDEYKLRKAYADANAINPNMYTAKDIYSGILSQISSTPVYSVKTDTQRISIVKVSDFTYSVVQSQTDFKTNVNFVTYMNYEDTFTNNKNLGIVFSSPTSALSLQHEISNIAISVLAKDGENYLAYNNAKFSMAGGECFVAYKKIGTENEYISIFAYNNLSVQSKVNYIQEQFDTQPSNSAFTKCYKPQISSSNINASLVELSIEDAGDYAFFITYLSNKYKLDSKTVEFSISEPISSAVSFNDNSSVNLIVKYKEEDDRTTPYILDYDISKKDGINNIYIPSSNFYTTVKYFAKATSTLPEGKKLSDYIYCTEKNIEGEVYYEISEGIIRDIGNCSDAIDLSFSVFFATVKTYANGSYKLDEGNYIFDQRSAKQGEEQVISFKIVDSLPVINYSLEGMEEKYKVVENDNTTLAVKQKVENSLELILSTETGKEQLLKDDFKNGEIELRAKTIGGTANIINDIFTIANDNDECKWTISTKALSGSNSIKINLYIYYAKTGKEILIDTFNEAEETKIDEIEIYSGVASRGFFGTNTKLGVGEDAPTEISELNTVSADNPIDVQTAFALEGGNSTISTTYTLNDEAINYFLDESNALVLTFEDKYGNTADADAGDYYLRSSETSVISVVGTKLTVKTKSTEPVKISLFLFDVEVDALFFDIVDSNATLSEIKCIAEKNELAEFSSGDDGSIVYSTASEINEINNGISIELYGAKSRTINSAELLNIVYADNNNENNYNVSNYLEYSFASEVSDDLSKMLNISYIEGTSKIESIEIIANFARDGILYIEAAIPDISFAINISLKLKQNITVTPHIQLDMSTEGAVPFVDSQTNNSYAAIYGGTTITIDATSINYFVGGADATAKSKVEVYLDDNKVFEDDTQDITLPDVSKYAQTTIRICVLVGEDLIENSYSYSRYLRYNINPNVKIGDVSNQKVENSDGSLFVDLEDSLKLVRKVGGSSLSGSLNILGEIKKNESNLLAFVEINSTNSSFEKFEDNKLKLAANNLLRPTTYKLVVGYSKDGNTFNVVQNASGSIKQKVNNIETTYYYVEFTVVPRIVAKANNENFVIYDGKKYFALVENETYSFADIANAFEATEIDGTSLSVSKVENQELIKTNLNAAVYWNYEESNVKILNINKIIGFNEEYYIYLKAGEYYVEYPAIILPFNYPFMENNYLTIDDENEVESTENDIKNLLSQEFLNANNLWHEKTVDGGDSLDLSEIFKSNILQEFTSFSVANAFSADTSVNATISDTNEGGTRILKLNTNLVSSDKYIFVIAKKGTGDYVVTLPIRIKIISNIQINLFYPYDTSGQAREYVSFGENETMQIDFNQIQSDSIPNKSEDGKRYSITKNDDSDFGEATRAIINNNTTFRVKNVNTFSEQTPITSQYAEFNGSVLTLKNYNDIYAFIVVVEIAVGNIVSAEYTIEVEALASVYSLSFENEGTGYDYDDAMDSFSIGEGNIEIKKFTLTKTIAQTDQIANSELNFAVYNDGDLISNLSFSNKTLKLNVGRSIVDRQATLVAFTKRGVIKTYNLTITSTVTTNIQDEFNADSDSSNVSITSSEGSTTITSMKIISLQQGTNDKILATSSNLISYTNLNSTVSTVEIIESDKLRISKFMVEVILELEITFEFKLTPDGPGQTATKRFITTILPDLFTDNEIYIIERSDLSDNKHDLSAHLNALFSWEEELNEKYNVTYTKTTSSELVSLTDEGQVTFMDTSVGGEVLIRVRATSIANDNYYIDNYAKCNVTKNVNLSITYPSISGETQSSEIIASGTSVDLTAIAPFASESRVVVTKVEIPEEAVNVKYVIASASNVTLAGVGENNVLTGSTVTPTLLADKTSGTVVVAIKTDSGDASAIIGYYNIVVRKTISEIFIPTLKNEDNTLNTETAPETTLEGITLDIGIYADTDEFLKKIVFGYDSSTASYLDKSTIVYDVSLTNSVIVAVSNFNLTVNSELITIDEFKNTIVGIDISLNSNKIATYFAKFIFKASVDNDEVTMYPNESKTIRELFGVTTATGYQMTLVKNNESLPLLKFYSRATEQGEWTEMEGDIPSFITFESDQTNVIAHGASNNGNKISFTIEIQCNSISQYYPVSIIVLNNYIVEIDEQPSEQYNEYLINSTDFGESDNLEITIATANTANSKITVTRDNGQLNQSNLLVVTNAWKATSSGDKTSAVDYYCKAELDSGVYKLFAKKSLLGVKDNVIVFADKYGYTFEFTTKIIPAEQNNPEFNSFQYTVFEKDSFALGGADKIKNNAGCTITSVKLDDETLDLDGISETIQIPEVQNQTTKTLYVELQKIVGEETITTTIYTSLIIKVRYDLVINENYSIDGHTYIRDGEKLELNDYLNIRDNKTGLVFGERYLTETKSFVINGSYVDGTRIYIYKTPVSVAEPDNVIQKSSQILISEAQDTVKLTDYFPTADYPNPEQYKYLVRLKSVSSDSTTTWSEISSGWVNYANLQQDGEIEVDMPEFVAETTYYVEVCRINANYQISVCTLSDNNKTADNNWYIPANETLFENPSLQDNNFFFATGINAVTVSRIFNIDVDTILTITSKEDINDLLLTLKNANNIKTVSLNIKEGRQKISLRSKLSDYVHGYSLANIDTEGVYLYHGLSLDNVKALKGITGSLGNIGENGIVEYDSASSWEVNTPQSVYQTRTYRVQLTSNGEIEKNYGSRNISVRILPTIFTISDISGAIVRNTQGYSMVEIEKESNSTNINLDDISSDIYARSINEFIFNGHDDSSLNLFEMSNANIEAYLMENSCALEFKVKVENTTGSAILNDNSITLDNFDYNYGHITIEYILKKTVGDTEIYSHKLGEVVITFSNTEA